MWQYGLYLNGTSGGVIHPESWVAGSHLRSSALGTAGGGRREAIACVENELLCSQKRKGGLLLAPEKPEPEQDRVAGYVSFPPDEKEPPAPPRKPGPRESAGRTFGWVRRFVQSRRRILRFVALFLSITFVLLAAYRLVRDTKANHYYLYSVARHTAWVLGIFGESAQVEWSDAEKGRETQVRAALAIWAERPDAPAENTTTDGPGSPLTPWEAYRFRILRDRNEFALIEGRIKTLAPPEPVEVHSREAHLGVINERLERLKASTTLPGIAGVRTLAADGVLSGIAEMTTTLGRLEESGQMDLRAFAGTLVEIELRIDELRIKQALFLDKQMTRLAQRRETDGPRVRFIASGSLAGELRDARERLAALDDEELSDRERWRETQSLEARIEQLEERRREYEGKGDPAAFDTARMFSFTVVPDCGAVPSISIFVAAVLAFPCLWRKRLIGVAAGVPVLYLVNLLRLACLAYLGAVDRGGEVFRFVHEYVWQGVFLVFVVIVWMSWYELLVRQWGTQPAQADE